MKKNERGIEKFLKGEIIVFSKFIKFLFVFAILIALVIPAYGEQTFKLLILGDSLASGYKLSPEKGFVPKLQKELNDDGLDNVEVINEAVAGETTFDGLKKINAILDKKPHAVILELGANDVLQNLDLEQTEKNLQEIITTLKKNQVAVMLIGINIPPTISENKGQKLNEIYKNLAKKNKLILYPNFLEGVVSQRFGSYNFENMIDSVHPNEKGVDLMIKNTYSVIKEFLMDI